MKTTRQSKLSGNLRPLRQRKHKQSCVNECRRFALGHEEDGETPIVPVFLYVRKDETEIRIDDFRLNEHCHYERVVQTEVKSLDKLSLLVFEF